VSVIFPLAGNDEDELDAGTRRYRGVRYEHGYGYGAAEHLPLRVPERGRGVNREAVALW
jgi:hypothetical protein